jgi:hypothetical protein
MQIYLNIYVHTTNFLFVNNDDTINIRTTFLLRIYLVPDYTGSKLSHQREKCDGRFLSERVKQRSRSCVTPKV